MIKARLKAIDRSKEPLNYCRYNSKYPNAAVFPPLTGTFVALGSNPRTGVTAGNVYQTNPRFNGVNPMISDFLLNAPVEQQFSIQGLQVYPREQRIGGLVKIDYEPTSWLKLYGSFLISPHLKPENADTYYARAAWSPGSSDPEH